MEALDLQPDPPEVIPSLHLLRLKAGEELLCLICSESVWGLNTHWAGNHSIPCYRDKKKCDGCKRGLPHRWKGFLHVCRCSDRRQFFLELTSTATTLFHDQVADKKKIRGLKIRAARGRGGDNSRLRIEVYGDKMEESKLPKSVDPLSTLQKIWRIQEGLEQGSTVQ